MLPSRAARRHSAIGREHDHEAVPAIPVSMPNVPCGRSADHVATASRGDEQGRMMARTRAGSSCPRRLSVREARPEGNDARGVRARGGATGGAAARTRAMLAGSP
jgi:hypothetical protein